jgi:hypothetical protein
VSPSTLTELSTETGRRELDAEHRGLHLDLDLAVAAVGEADDLGGDSGRRRPSGSALAALRSWS